MVAVSGERVEGEQQRDEHDAADEHVEEDGESAGLDGAEEARALGQRKLPKTRPECEGCSEGGDPTERTARHTRWEGGVNQHHEHAGAGKNDLRKDAEDVGHGIHCCTSRLSSKFRLCCWAVGNGCAWGG